MPKTPLKDSFKRIPTESGKLSATRGMGFATTKKPIQPTRKPVKTMPISTTASRSKGFSVDTPAQKKFNAAQLARAKKK